MTGPIAVMEFSSLWSISPTSMSPATASTEALAAVIWAKETSYHARSAESGQAVVEISSWSIPRTSMFPAPASTEASAVVIWAKEIFYHAMSAEPGQAVIYGDLGAHGNWLLPAPIISSP